VRGYRLIVLALLLSVSSVWAGLMPFQISDGIAIPVNQDSISLLEVVVTSGEEGMLNWVFRLGGSPSEDLSIWVGFPGSGKLVTQGTPNIIPPSTEAIYIVPKTAAQIPITLYQIDFPGDKITLTTLKTTTPSPWDVLEGHGVGDTEIWEANVEVTGLDMWDSLVDHAKFVLEYPTELKQAWLNDPKNFQVTVVPLSAEVEKENITWEFRRWEAKQGVSVQVTVYRPLLGEQQLLQSGLPKLPEEYFGDKVEYSDSLLNGYLWMPEFNQLSSSSERGVFARAYLLIRQNEILARRGFQFKGQDALRAYFEQQPWYRQDPKFRAEMLSEIEMKNFWKLINRRSEFLPQFPDVRE